MRVVVLVKQVPDVRAGRVAIHEDGTIDRSSAAAITNPSDLHAVEAALRLSADVWVVSMGPPAAESTLRQALALGAHHAVLLTDRAFAGSDTWATANALAAAIDRIGEWGMVLTGATALDGETGQVGPQVAERLGIPHATGCEVLEMEGSACRARRIIEGGYQELRFPLPALVGVSETGFSPRYPTLPGRRKAARAEITIWRADDLGLGPDQVGLAASPTKVAAMHAVPRRPPHCRFVGADLTMDDLVAAMRDRGVAGAEPGAEPLAMGESETRVPWSNGDTPDPALWVVTEPTGDGLTAGSLELISAASALAPRLGGSAAAVILGGDPESLAPVAARHGADVVLVGRDPALDPYRCLPHARVIADAIAARSPQAVLFSATTTGRDLAPRVAARLGAGLAADCTDLAVADWERRGERYPDLLHMIRPALSGGVLATCLAPVARPQMATVRPGVFAVGTHRRRLVVEPLPVNLSPSDLTVEVIDEAVERGDVALSAADVIVAGGAGCDAANWRLVEELASALGGKVAASRGAVESALAPRSIQVGQTGVTVRPHLYVACGISGALQHLVGMQGSGTVVAINRDRDAPIFAHAAYGVVGDVADVLPALTQRLRDRVPAS